MLFGLLVPTFAGNTAIGLAVSPGHLLVNGARVNGNATLTEGLELRTENAPGSVHYANGATVLLDRNSRAKVFADHLLLEDGAGQTGGKQPMAVWSLGFRVVAEASSQARVDRKQDIVTVESLRGPVGVFSKEGVLLARVTEGRALSFQPMATKDGMSSYTGRIAKDGNRFVIPDEVTGRTIEVEGVGLDREIGQRVTVRGTASADQQKVLVARMNRVAEEAPMPEPAPSPAPAAPLALPGIVAIIGGIAGAISIAAYVANRSNP
jgi:hypothetical protein